MPFEILVVKNIEDVTRRKIMAEWPVLPAVVFFLICWKYKSQNLYLRKSPERLKECDAEGFGEVN